MTDINDAIMDLKTQVAEHDNNISTKDATMDTMHKNNQLTSGGDKDPKEQAVRTDHQENRHIRLQERQLVE